MKEKINKSYDLAYVNALKATKLCKFKIINENIDSGLITFRVGWSIWSWGETFKVQLTKITQDQTELEVSSDSFQWGSWGKHEKNIRDFLNQLNEFLK